MKRFWTIASPVIVGAIIVLLIAFYRDWQSWLSLETGSRNNGSTPPNYNYWSGFGSVFPWGMGVLGAMLTLVWHNVRKNNCHVQGCWRIGIHHTSNGEFFVCKKHHSEITGHPRKLTLDYLKRHHKKVTDV